MVGRPFSLIQRLAADAIDTAASSLKPTFNNSAPIRSCSFGATVAIRETLVIDLEERRMTGYNSVIERHIGQARNDLGKRPVLGLEVDLAFIETCAENAAVNLSCRGGEKWLKTNWSFCLKNRALDKT